MTQWRQHKLHNQVEFEECHDSITKYMLDDGSDFDLAVSFVAGQVPGADNYAHLRWDGIRLLATFLGLTLVLFVVVVV
jgi:hypothetical protein